MKLKKSLLIVPAMATLLLAAAGSVGGTVAWFSATTTFKTDITSFKVVRLDGDLSCEMKPGTGTAQDGAAIKIATGAELTHGSFNHTTGQVSVKTGTEVIDAVEKDVYTAKATVPNSDNPASPTELTGLLAGSYTDTTGSHNVYYAVTWFMTFQYKLPATTATAGNVYNLYLDTANSVFTETLGSGSYEGKETHKGFRIAFYPNAQPKTASNTQNARVWADDQVAANCTYVSAVGGSGASATSSYSSPFLIDSANSTVIAEGTSGADNIDICLGQFSNYSGGISKLGFTCVAWFEGTDANVINESTLDTVVTSLAFYTRNNA